MRIAYLSFSELLSRSANSVHVMKMCQAFAKRGHRVVLFASRGNELTDDIFGFYGVEPCFTIEICHHPSMLRGGGGKYALEARKRARHLGLPQLFYGRHLYSLMAVANLGVPMVFETHALPRNVIERELQKWLLRRRNLRRLVLISQALLRDYLSMFPWLRSSQVIVAPDGADVPPSPGDRDPVDWPGRKACLQVGYVGHLYPGRGVEVMLAMARGSPSVDYHVIGGTEEDLAYWRRLPSPANLYYHGYVPNGRLAPYFDRLDVVLAPYQKRVAAARGKGDTSRWMSPMKIFEYMSYGKAIVCSDLPVLREILRHGDTALLVEPEDVEQWIAAVKTLNSDPDLRQELGLRANRELCTRYTWSGRAERVLEGVSSSQP